MLLQEISLCELSNNSAWNEQLLQKEKNMLLQEFKLCYLYATYWPQCPYFCAQGRLLWNISSIQDQNLHPTPSLTPLQKRPKVPYLSNLE